MKIFKRILTISLMFLMLIGAATVLSSCSNKVYYSISNVTYDPEAKILSWSDNSSAEEWVVTINNKNKRSKTTSYSYDSKDQDFTFKIEGLRKRKGHRKNPEEYGTFKYLDKVTNLKVENGNVTWSPVSRANYYQIYENGYHVTDVYTTSYEVPSGSFNVSVVPAVNDSYFYSYSPDTISGVMLSRPSNLMFANGVFTWDAVFNAEYYEVTVNGNTTQVLENKYVYNGPNVDIEISIVACTSAANSYSSAPLATTCYYLKPVESAQFTNEGVLTWNQIQNADSYALNINGNFVSVGINEYGSFQFDTPYTVTITPEKPGYLYYTGESFTYSFEKLSPVSGIKFSDGTVMWNAHPRAVEYEIVVSGQKFKTSSTTYQLGHSEADLTIEVYAIGSGENCRSVTSDKLEYFYIQPVKNFRVQDGVLVWDASPRATSYEIYFTNQGSQTVTGTTFTGINPGVQYVAKIIPRGEGANYYSYWSGELMFQVLQAPTVNYDQGVLRWSSSSSARGFNIKIEKPDGSVQIIDTSNSVYNYGFTDVGSYKVSVQAVADASLANTYNSAFSTPLSIKRLGTPTSHRVINNQGTTDTVQLSIGAVDSACGYKVFINDANETNFASNEFALDLLSIDRDHSEKTYKISVAATGKITSNEIILDSLNRYDFNLTRLATPTGLKAEGTQITWNPVTHANKYYVAIGGKKIETNTNSYQFTELQPGTYKVKIQAANTDNTDYIPGQYSAELEITKLATPTNVVLKTTADGSVFLEWSKVENATGYTVRFGDRYFNTSYNNYKISDHFNTIEEGSGLQITVSAIGNSKEIINSEPSVTKTVAKLPKPSNIAVNGTNITWNSSSVDGIGASNYVLYIRTAAGTQEIPVTGTSYSCAEFTPGSYSVSVAAIGSIISDGSACTLDSSKSSEITVTKLDTVKNIQKATGSNTITWDSVIGASSYMVMIDGQKEYTTTTSFQLNFSSAGEHTIVIQPISNDPYTLSGEQTTITQVVKSLKTPVYVQGADTSALNIGEFTVIQDGASVTVVVAPYTGMPVKYDYIFGSSYKSDSNTHSIVLENSGIEYYLQIRVLYNGFGDDGIYYVDSNLSQEIVVVWFN